MKPHLTSREFMVVRSILDGMQNNDIAKSLGMTKRTVKSHKERIFIKFGIENKWDKQVRLVWILSGGWNGTRSPVALS